MSERTGISCVSTLPEDLETCLGREGLRARDHALCA